MLHEDPTPDQWPCRVHKQPCVYVCVTVCMTVGGGGGGGGGEGEGGRELRER